MVERLDGYMESLDAVWENQLEAANARLSELGMEELDPWDESTEVWAPEGM